MYVRLWINGVYVCLFEIYSQILFGFLSELILSLSKNDNIINLKMY